MSKYKGPALVAMVLTALGLGIFSAVYVVVASPATNGAEEPIPSSNFLTEIDGIVSTGPWWYLDGIAMGTDVITIRDASGLPEMKLPGEVHAAPEGIIIRGPFSKNRSDMRAWAESIMNGDNDPRNASIVVLGRDRTEVYRFNLVNAWVSNYRVGPLGPAHAQGCVNCPDQILQEEFTLQAEKIELSDD